MLGEMVPRFQGRASLWLARKAAENVDALIADLIFGAVILWQRDSFSRFKDNELSCTIRLYACCRQVLSNERSKYAQVDISYEAAQPSEDMLAGLADPLRTPRPDLTLKIGVTQIRLEAKLLGEEKRLASLYVTQGMARFLDGRYGQPNVPGVMIAYLLSGDPPTVVDRINSALTSHLKCVPTESLVPQESAHSLVFVHHSQHTAGIRLIHKMIDLRPDAQTTSAVK